MVTRVGDQNLLMMQCHIAHDCLLGDRNVVANGATLGGHVVVEDFVIVGGWSESINSCALARGDPRRRLRWFRKDVPPYCNATGDRAKLHGLNLEGLKRRGFDKTVIALLRKAYRIVFQSATQNRGCPEKNPRRIASDSRNRKICFTSLHSPGAGFAAESALITA